MVVGDTAVAVMGAAASGTDVGSTASDTDVDMGATPIASGTDVNMVSAAAPDTASNSGGTAAAVGAGSADTTSTAITDATTAAATETGCREFFKIKQGHQPPCCQYFGPHI